MTATAAKPFPRYLDCNLPRSVALAAPAVRMLIVEAWADEGGADHRLCPVLAILAVASDDYSIEDRRGVYPRRSPTHRGMTGSGWTYEDSRVRFEAVIMDDDWGLCVASQAMEGVNVVHETVACPWPDEEDAERLAPVIARVKEAARAKVEAEGRRPAPAAVAR